MIWQNIFGESLWYLHFLLINRNRSKVVVCTYFTKRFQKHSKIKKTFKWYFLNCIAITIYVFGRSCLAPKTSFFAKTATVKICFSCIHSCASLSKNSYIPLMAAWKEATSRSSFPLESYPYTFLPIFSAKK